MEASREFCRTPPHLPPCSDLSVLQKTRMYHFLDTHHSANAGPAIGIVFAQDVQVRIQRDWVRDP